MNANVRLLTAARAVLVMLALMSWTATGCSAIELHGQMGSATANALADATAATANPTLAVLATQRSHAEATAQTLLTGATQAAATIAALEATPTTARLQASDPPSRPESAEIAIYGSVPIDSDRLNTVAALAFDTDGRLLVATRAGEIYALPDRDGDGRADETRLVFADEAQQLGQVAGLVVQGDALLLLDGQRLSLLTDSDGDGAFDSVTRLADGLPAGQSPLQASNGIAQAPDGRLFTVDVNSGEILQIVLRE